MLAQYMAKWIVDHHRFRPFEKDHACSRCVPNEDGVVPGFVCVMHVAEGMVAAYNPTDGLGDVEAPKRRGGDER